MKIQHKFLFTLCLLSAILFSITNSFATNGIGNTLNTVCAPNSASPYTGSNCNLCHVSNTSTITAAMEAYNIGGTTRTDFFCPAPPPTAPTCTDGDNDNYNIEGGDICGPVDCNDTDPDINPGAVENCTDGFDNNCNDLVDTMDPNAAGCPVECTDNDNDGYSSDGGTCGQIDCDDDDWSVNPGAAESCNDGIDNDCNGRIDEGCDTSCLDMDSDGYMDAGCGGTDCDDNNDLINPGTAEICGNGTDENCNGMGDDTCQTPPSPLQDGGDDDDEVDTDDDEDDDNEIRNNDNNEDERRDRRRRSRRDRRSHDND